MNAQERKQALLDARLVCLAELEQLGIPVETMPKLSNIVARYTARCVRVEMTYVQSKTELSEAQRAVRKVDALIDQIVGRRASSRR